ncbi:MAG: hypothetical protein R3F43_03505 [bacterium]
MAPSNTTLCPGINSPPRWACQRTEHGLSWGVAGLSRRIARSAARALAFGFRLALTAALLAGHLNLVLPRPPPATPESVAADIPAQLRFAAPPR